MAATAAQVLANRENSKFSTGPASSEGKDRAKMNALRSGLTARGLIVPLGLEPVFAQLEESLRNFLVPVGGLENTLFERILECAWNLHRCRLAAAQLFAASEDQSIDPLLDDQNSAKYDRIHKYARQNESSMLKMMRELGRIQTEAQAREHIYPITDEIRDDPEEFNRTPQSMSAVLNYPEVVKASQTRARDHRPGEPLQNEAKAPNAKDREQAVFALLDRLTAPPRLDNDEDEMLDFQNEADAA